MIIEQAIPHKIRNKYLRKESSVVSSTSGGSAGVPDTRIDELTKYIDLFKELFEKENIGSEETPSYVIKAKFSLYSVGGITAYAGSGDDDIVPYNELEQLVDVNLSNLSENQYLKYDGQHWVNASIGSLSLEGYATEAWVDAKNYITSQSLTNYATKDWCNANFSTGTTDTWRPLGTGANEACAGNDYRLSDARPASDVYSWAKAYSKPSYSYDEVGAAAATHYHDYLPLTGGSLGGSLSVTGDILATGDVTCYSDIRLKDDIRTLENRGYINPVTYIKDGKRSIGFIAQDVQRLYPELVAEDNTDNHYLSVNYVQYTAVLQAQIIEQSEIIVILRNEVNDLKNKLSRYGIQ